jgi:hypothetical protein
MASMASESILNLSAAKATLAFTKAAEMCFLFVLHEFWWFLKAAGWVNALPQGHEYGTTFAANWYRSAEDLDMQDSTSEGLRVIFQEIY